MKAGVLFALASVGLVEAGFLSERFDADQAAFVQYVNEFGKSYGTKEEFMFRLDAFKKQRKAVLEHNEAKTGHSVVLNEFSDWTDAEYKRMLGFKYNKDFKAEESPLPVKQVEANLSATPASFDWRDHNGVSPVKNQGACGSCWAFAATAAMESAYFIQQGTMMTFSEQQLVDCVTNTQGCCNGCYGGLYHPAWAYLAIANQGAISDGQYPYKASQGTCQTKSEPVQQIPQGLIQVGNTVAQMKDALVQRPLAVAIEAENNQFRAYGGGVIKSGCGTNIDHAVAAVGFGTDTDGTDYFIIKNSWGSAWGEQGYVRIAGTQCGITILPLGVTMTP